MKSSLDGLGTVKIVSGSAKIETGPDALGTSQNDFDSAKHENGAPHPRCRPKRVQERKT
jgi:hypothetical protein